MVTGRTFKRAVQDLVDAAQARAFMGSQPKEMHAAIEQDLVDSRRRVLLMHEQFESGRTQQAPSPDVVMLSATLIRCAALLSITLLLANDKYEENEELAGDVDDAFAVRWARNICANIMGQE